MKFKIIAFLLLTIATPAWAVSYDQTITAIFGTGNPNGGWAADTNNNIELGLRAKNRTTGATPDSNNGIYTFATGVDPAHTNRALWNFEFSINSDVSGMPGPTTGNSLVDYVFVLSVDTDPSQGTNFTTFNPVSAIPDNSMGNNGTANGAGVETGPGSAFMFNIAQNSENITFSAFGSGDPNADATYDYRLAAYAIGDTMFLHPLAFISIQVIVGDGGARVPDSGTTVAMLGVGLLGMAGFGLRKRLAKI